MAAAMQLMAVAPAQGDTAGIDASPVLYGSSALLRVPFPSLVVLQQLPWLLDVPYSFSISTAHCTTSSGCSRCA